MAWSRAWWNKLFESRVDPSTITEGITITPTEIGRGSYGTVYAAVYNGKECVAKEMHPYLLYASRLYSSALSPVELILKEINILRSLSHPSIVQFLGVYFRDGSSTPILIMERLWKNLCNLLEEYPNQLFLLTKTHILYDVACGLQYLHNQKKPVVHRDLHPGNILLSAYLEAKIADLGQAKVCESISTQKLSTAPGNIIFMAPETLEHKPTYNIKLDVFSFGCTIIHLITEKYPVPSDPFESVKYTNTFRKVSEVDRRNEYLRLMADISILKEMACRCLEDTSTNRPTASCICKELREYIQQLETESPTLAKRHKQDKASLLWLLQSTESQLELKNDELEKEKRVYGDAITKRETSISLLESKLLHSEKELEKLDEQRKVHKNEVENLKVAIKCEQENSEKRFQELQKKINTEQQNLSLERNKCADLERSLQSVKDSMVKECSNVTATQLMTDNENMKQQIIELRKELEDRNKTVDASMPIMEPLISNKFAKDQRPTEQAVLIEQLSKEKSTLMDQLKYNQEEHKKVSLDNERLQQELDGCTEELKIQIESFKSAQQKLDDATMLSTILQQQLDCLTNELKDVHEKRRSELQEVSMSLNDCKRNMTELKDSMVLEMNSFQVKLKQQHQQFCKAKNTDFTMKLNKCKRHWDQEKDKLHQRIEQLQSDLDHTQEDFTDSIKMVGRLSDRIKKQEAYRKQIFAITSQSTSLDHKRSYSKGSNRTLSNYKSHTTDDSDDGSLESSFIPKRGQTKHSSLPYAFNYKFEQMEVSSEDTESDLLHEMSSKSKSMD